MDIQLLRDPCKPRVLRISNVALSLEVLRVSTMTCPLGYYERFSVVFICAIKCSQTATVDYRWINANPASVNAALST